MRMIAGVPAEIEPAFYVGGTDGVRGEARLGNVVEEGFVSDSEVTLLTTSLVLEQRETGSDGPLIIGHDPRPTGPAFERAAVAGALAAGMREQDIIRVGVAPTPMILKTAALHGAMAAVSLTASHNEHPDNGWKGTFGPDKPVGAQNDAINSRFWRIRRNGLAVPEHISDPGDSTKYHEQYVETVVDDIRQQFNNERPLAGKVFVVDGAYGAAGNVAPQVFEALGATVIPYACDKSGNINDGCGATDLEGVQKFVQQLPAELVRSKAFGGIVGFDGDADRYIGQGVTFEGNELVFHTLDGNRVMELLAEDQEGIIGTDYTNDGMLERLKERGVGFEFCRNGDTSVTVALRARQAAGDNWTRGGEFTGHQVDLEWLSSGDGIRVAAWVAALAANRGQNFGEMAQEMPLWPEIMKKIKRVSGAGSAILEHSAVIEAVGEAERAIVASGGRLLVRASGTEIKVVRAWGVGPDKSLIARNLQMVRSAASQHFELAA